MDIGEVARRTGMPASRLRYYEERGLIASVGRHGLRRTFDPAVLEQLALISLGQAAGFSLDEIAQMFTPERTLQIDRHLLRAKADQVEALARRLQAMASGLRHAARCPAPDHMACPSFRRLIQAAAQGKLGGAQEGPARRGGRRAATP